MQKTRNVLQVRPLGTVAGQPVTVRAGLFFDGTANNRVNSRIGAECQAMMEVNAGRHTAQCAGRHLESGSSYSNELSNIAWLVELYRHQSLAQDDGQGLKVHWPIYISGAGTTSGGRDSLWPGQSFGRGLTGVVAKVERAFTKLESRLKRFAQDNPGCVIQALELDVFGFSRGAASARHFVNEILKQSKGALEPILSSRRVPRSRCFAWHNDSVKVRFVGLFDTVAAVGSFKDLGNISDASNVRVNLYLPQGCAEHVVHLVARDEARRNFALNSIAPVWSREIVLPGAHADIGGGYPVQMLEQVLLTRPRVSLVYRDSPCEASQAWLNSLADLQHMDAERWMLDPGDTQASLRVECCESIGRGRSSRLGAKTVAAAVCLRRQVYGHLSRVHLRVMHDLACQAGVPLLPIPNRPQFTLPSELRSIAGKLMYYARGGPYTLDEHEERILRWRYIHRSAHWGGTLGSIGTLSDAVFVHAPAPGGRVRHPNVGQPGYPQ
ncbi:DUF2235 domain-containing protein [Pseudomonas sp. v388]|uniref:T6SS phospholipase effector Tle1-like catalytic domain-containing protein n=1 Tax=Pseudomonas sp. v388 TaxID=2479849 RepID=UPI000F768FEC|nr:DUF2235 domain-containing protein [Pseudomonas sp. v388]RRV05738.1 DUF2235 domain-containing protein [Pseudomonas sp. v388]